MIEARVFIDSLDNAREILHQENAEGKGQYKIYDTIYRNTHDDVPLIDEFLRLRVVPENIWTEKAVILALKQTKLHSIGKASRVPLKLEFDEPQQAEAYYEQHLKAKYTQDFEFWRIGWQYLLPSGDVVDLEIIERDHPSIELKSNTDEGLEALLEKFNIRQSEVIIGPSVVAVKNILAHTKATGQ